MNEDPDAAVTRSTRAFYDDYGWQGEDGTRGEDLLFRQFSDAYRAYHQSVDARTIETICERSGRLMIVGGGDLVGAHMPIARSFDQVTCLDLSHQALRVAHEKLGEQAQCVQGSALQMPFPDACVDAVYCAHVVYHIHADAQATAVREMLRMVRPGGRVVILYSNPNSLPARLIAARNKVPGLWRLRRRRRVVNVGDGESPHLYFAPQPLEWWEQFSDVANVRLLPWSVLSSGQEEQLVLLDVLGWPLYALCRWIERRMPERAARWWTYQIVVLDRLERSD